ncbi:hypothetical protein AAD018_014035 [Aestuariibius insulae]|uniref:hypothetical protein n=1 Tax=Aestuariibius insulae TaxID=2058287 RepID=UPI00345E3763
MTEDQTAISNFMRWFRIASEKAWANLRERDLASFRAQEVGGLSHRRGTHWLNGFSEEEIERIEAREGRALPFELKTFLRICGKTDRGFMSFGYNDDNVIVQRPDVPIFYDWSDDGQIAIARQSIRSRILSHVETGSWLKEWGPRPADLSSAMTMAAEKIEDGAPLYPLHSHRAVLPLSARSLSPVLSCHGLDTTIYSSSLCRNLVEDTGLDLDLSDAPPVPDQDARAIHSEVHQMPFWGLLV